MRCQLIRGKKLKKNFLFFFRVGVFFVFAGQMYIGKTVTCDLTFAGVAQLAEHVLGKDGVTSSILVSS